MISENARQNSINSYVTKSTYIINTLLLLYHVFFGFLFYKNQAHYLYYFNYISILTYLVCYFILYKQKSYLYIAVVFLEIYVFMLLSVIGIGWDYGFQQYCFSFVASLLFTDFYMNKRHKLPQYYVEGHHEGIVTADQFDQVQAEILRRKGMQKYSGVGLFSSIIKCGECGSWYGAKVWHSNDKYRKVIYRCNNKYADGCKCKTPHINEDELKELFIKAANELFSEREEILANTKVMMEMVCETDSLDRDLQDSITELNIISEQMQIAIAENSRVALDQDEYEKRYAELTARYEKAKAKYDDIAEQIESKKAKRELFKGFIRTLEKQDGLMEDFDAGIWSSLVQEVIVKTKDDIRFIFKNGFEVRV